MNRREAIAALTSLPAVARLSVAKLEPDDVIVIESDQGLDLDEIRNIEEALQRVWPGRKIVVLGDALRMKVVSGK